MRILNAAVCVGFILFAITVNAQVPHKSVHQLQHETYKHRSFRLELPGTDKARIPLHPRQNPPEVEVFGFSPYWSGTDYQEYDWDLLTTVAFFGADVDSSGEIIDYHGFPVNSLINTAHSNGVKVVLTAVLFDSDDIDTLLSSVTYRQNLVSNLLTVVQTAGADGVNIDFEGMPSGQRANFVTFIQDLATAFHSAIDGSQVTVDLPAVDWGDQFDEAGLADVCDGLFIMAYDYHWRSGPTTGPVSPLTSEGSDITQTVADYLSNTDDARDKLILGVPWYGYQWIAENSYPGSVTLQYDNAATYAVAEPLAQSFGKIRYAAGGQIPWFRYETEGDWLQGWYDDSLSLSLKYNLAASEDLAGVGVWALGYDGGRPEMWSALERYVSPVTAASKTPDRFYLKTSADGNEVVVGVAPDTGATSYRIYSSGDGEAFTSLGRYTSPVNMLGDVSPNQIGYFNVTTVNEFGESAPTEVLAAVPGESSAQALVVNGFDRMSGTTNTRDFIRQHGTALIVNGVRFDAASNEAVISGEVDLNDYAMVDWILGEEGAANSAFDSAEQAIVRTYLENGGNLLVSGSEVGYDLVSQGQPDDQEFFSDYLKAEYVSDAANAPRSFYPDGAAIFDGLGTMSFDDGTRGTYNVDYPDGIKPVGGAEIALKYDGVDYETYGGAGIIYTGTFGESSEISRLVHISPGFETIYPTASRTSVMNRIVDYFRIPTGVADDPDGEIPATFALTGAYPNPFNSDVTIEYTIPDDSHRRFVLRVFDLLGREIVSLFDGHQTAGEYSVRWNGKSTHGSPVSSGVYIVAGQYGERYQTLKVTYLK